MHPGTGISWNTPDAVNEWATGDGTEEGPEIFFNDEDASELYNAVEALHANKPVAFLLPRRDVVPMVVATTKKGGRGYRKAPGYVELPTVPAGPAGILTCIDISEGADTERDETDAAGKRRRAALVPGPAAVTKGSNAGANVSRKRARAPPPSESLYVEGTDEHGASDGLLRATNVHLASMPVVSSLMHLKHVPIEDACKATGTPQGVSDSSQTPAAYCSYADLYAKLQRIESNVAK